MSQPKLSPSVLRRDQKVQILEPFNETKSSEWQKIMAVLEITPSEIATFLTFFDQFRSHDKIDADSDATGETAFWTIPAHFSFETQFFVASESRLQHGLSKFGYKLKKITPGTEMTTMQEFKGSTEEKKLSIILFDSSERPLTNKIVSQLVEDVELLLAAPGVPLFDFQNIMRTVITACAELIAGACPELAKAAEDVKKRFKVVPNVISGESFMIQFEICYQTDMENFVISYPDTYRLTTAHHLEMVKTRKRQALGRLHRRIMYCSYVATCHEVIHAFQGAWDQVDGTPMGWSSEHDASFPCNSILWQICAPKPPSVRDTKLRTALDTVYKIMSAKGLVWDGLREDLMLELVDTGLKAYQSWDAKTLKQYHIWRDSFGLTAPADFINKNSNLVSEFKEVLSLDCFYSDLPYLEAQLNLIFRGRQGNVYKCEILPQNVTERVTYKGGSEMISLLITARELHASTASASSSLVSSSSSSSSSSSLSSSSSSSSSSSFSSSVRK